MKRQRAIWEYFPSPDIIRQVEGNDRLYHIVDNNAPSITPERPPVTPINQFNYINLDEDEEDELMSQLVLMIDQNCEKVIKERPPPRLSTEEDRIKKLDEFRQSLIKDVESKRMEKKEHRYDGPVDPIVLERIASNKEYNASIPCILTVDCILPNIMRFASIESFVLLQRTSCQLYKLIDINLNTTKYHCVRVDKSITLNCLFDSTKISGLLGRLKKTTRAIMYSPRITESKKEKSEAIEEVVHPPYVPRLKYHETYLAPPLLEMMIINLSQTADVDELLHNYSLANLSLRVFYCPGRLVARSDVLLRRVYDYMGGSHRAISAFSVDYDPYGLNFDAIDNTAMPSFI